MTRPSAFLVALGATVALTGCPGTTPSSCTRTEAATTGPGDARALFPAAVGDLWAYRVTATSGGYRSRVEVIGPATAGGRTGVLLTDTSMGSAAPLNTSTVVATGPGGVTVLSSQQWDDLAPGLGALIGPYLLLRFPVEAGDRFVAYDCRGLQAGSLDQDARADPVDVRAVVTVAGEETVTTPAGDRQAVRVDTRIDLTVHSSQVGSQAFVDLQQDWYVPGLGLVRSSETFTAPAQPVESAASSLYAWSVGGETVGPVTRPVDLPPDAITAGEVAPDGWQTYRASAPAGPVQVVGLVGQAGPLGLRSAGGAGFPLWSCNLAPSVEAQHCLVQGGAGALAFDVDGGGLTASSARYGVFMAPQPALAAYADETAAVPLGVVTAGQVATRGTSRYTTPGVTPGVPVVVALLGQTGAADLRVYSGPFPSPELDCTLPNSSVLPTPQSCIFTPAADSVSFAVQAGPLNRDGAGFLVLVWPAP